MFGNLSENFKYYIDVIWTIPDVLFSINLCNVLPYCFNSYQSCRISLISDSVQCLLMWGTLKFFIKVAIKSNNFKHWYQFSKLLKLDICVACKQVVICAKSCTVLNFSNSWLIFISAELSYLRSLFLQASPNVQSDVQCSNIAE